MIEKLISSEQLPNPTPATQEATGMGRGVLLTVNSPPEMTEVYEALGPRQHVMQMEVDFDWDALLGMDRFDVLHSFWNVGFENGRELKEEPERLVARVGDKVFICHQRRKTQVIGADPQSAREAVRELVAMGILKRHGAMSERPLFKLIHSEPDGFYYGVPVELKSGTPMSHEDLVLHYGENFADWEAEFRRLLQRRSGLTLLHGPAGTGKTFFIRHLIAVLRHSHIFYAIPASCHGLLSDPHQVGFWSAEKEQYPDRQFVIVLEDVDSLLLERKPDNEGPLSNLLNLTEGLLGDLIEPRVLCTVNCDRQRLDPAVIRPGRLVASWHFDRMAPEAAKRLAKAQNLPDIMDGQFDYSLAEIYHQTVNPFPETSQTFGFNVS